MLKYESVLELKSVFRVIVSALPPQLIDYENCFNSDRFAIRT